MAGILCVLMCGRLPMPCLREVRLHPADIVLHDVHVHGDGGRVEIADERHARLLCRVRVNGDIARRSAITRARSR